MIDKDFLKVYAEHRYDTEGAIKSFAEEKITEKKPRGNWSIEDITFTFRDEEEFTLGCNLEYRCGGYYSHNDFEFVNSTWDGLLEYMNK